MSISAANAVVAINTLAVNPSNEGTRTMLTRLLPALRAVDPGLKQLLICSPANRHLFEGIGEVVEVSLREDQIVRRIFNDQIMVPRLVRDSADVLVTPTSVGPLRISIPHVAVVAAHLPLPSCRRLAGKAGLGLVHRMYYGAPFRQYLRGAQQVLGISQFLADGIVKELGIDRAKVRGMPLGVEQSVQPPELTGRSPLVLFLGTLYGYKDALTAVRSFAMARPNLPVGSRLVVAGKDPLGQLPALRQVAKDLGAQMDIEFPGAISDQRRSDLYATASAMLMPSRCEGFGLPVAEAMASGVPVIVADATSLPEVARGAGILVAPGDVGGFADAITAILSDPVFHLDLAVRGLARSRELTWEASAQILRDAIRDALSGVSK